MQSIGQGLNQDPSFMAKKTCTMLTTVLNDCMTCLPPDMLNMIKKSFYDSTVKEQLKKNPGFDNAKCPVLKKFTQNSVSASTSSFAMILLGCVMALMS